jgi:hypothetical protein
MTTVGQNHGISRGGRANRRSIGGPVHVRWALDRWLSASLVELIERDGLSVAAAARTMGMDVAAAGVLVRLWAIEREVEETELEDRLDRIQELCPGEDWFSYAPRQLDAIARGESVPNRIVRELALQWCRRNRSSLTQLARKVGMDDTRLRRALGVSEMGLRPNRGPQRQKTLTVECATRIVRALGIPPCEVPGL